MTMQQFHKGDWVRATRCFEHEKSEAIVIGSYKDQYGGSSPSNTKEYTLLFKSGVQSSWYREDDLELIERGRYELLDQWEREQEADIKQKSDLDWIFENGPDVAKHGYGASLSTLGRCLGIKDLWGSHGEGFTYAINSMRVLAMAYPFLMAKDKEGWARVVLAVAHGAPG